jgi:thioredoxin reductase (NADPH)
MNQVIIIGSGPAGHTAAIYAARANLAPLMFEGRMAGGVAAGGQLTTTTEVENFPGFPHGIQGPELMNNMREQSINAGTTIITKTVDRVDLSVRPFKIFVKDDIYEAQSIIIATGATAKKLDIPWVSEYWMKGISGCAVCDGALPIFRNKPLAVIGGGDVALEEATHLAKFGSKVYVLIRRGKWDLRASKAMQERAFVNEKIKFLEYTEALEVHGGKLLSHLTIINNQTQQKSFLEVSGLFFAIGHTPNTGFLDGQIALDETKYIITKAGTTETSIPWVFAAGDVQDKKYRQAITSAGTGCMAALEAEAWLSEQK